MIGKRFFLLVALLSLVALAPVRAGSNVSSFFDDFTSSQLSAIWQPDGTANAIQSGGFLTLPMIRTATAVSFGGSLRVIANVTQSPLGLVGANTPDGQFIEMIWKLQPFNYSSSNSPPVVKNAEVILGLSNGGASSPFSHGFGVMMEESDSIAGNGNALLGSRSMVGLFFERPMTSTAINCFASGYVDGGVNPSWAAQTCSGGTNPLIQYEPKVGTFDLNAMHILTFDMRLYPVSHKSWVAFHLDDNAVLNVTQQACNCIDASSGSYAELYPFVSIYYCGGTSGGGISCSSTVADQSVAANVDYLLVSDAPITSPPAGQLLRPSGTPPPVLPQPGVTGSLVDFLQFEANSIAPGNIYAGGMMLMGIVSLAIFLAMGLAIRKTGAGLRIFGFSFTMTTLVMSYLGAFASILPIWIPAMTTIIAIGFVFG